MFIRDGFFLSKDSLGLLLSVQFPLAIFGLVFISSTFLVLLKGQDVPLYDVHLGLHLCAITSIVALASSEVSRLGVEDPSNRLELGGTRVTKTFLYYSPRILMLFNGAAFVFAYTHTIPTRNEVERVCTKVYFFGLHSISSKRVKVGCLIIGVLFIVIPVYTRVGLFCLRFLQALVSVLLQTTRFAIELGFDFCWMVKSGFMAAISGIFRQRRTVQGIQEHIPLRKRREVERTAESPSHGKAIGFPTARNEEMGSRGRLEVGETSGTSGAAVGSQVVTEESETITLDGAPCSAPEESERSDAAVKTQVCTEENEGGTAPALSHSSPEGSGRSGADAESQVADGSGRSDAAVESQAGTEENEGGTAPALPHLSVEDAETHVSMVEDEGGSTVPINESHSPPEASGASDATVEPQVALEEKEASIAGSELRRTAEEESGVHDVPVETAPPEDSETSSLRSEQRVPIPPTPTPTPTIRIRQRTTAEGSAFTDEPSASTHVVESTSEDEKYPYPKWVKRLKDFRLIEHNFSTGFFIMSAIIIYIIVCIELTARSNRVNSEDRSWGVGQYASVLSSGPAILFTMEALFLTVVRERDLSKDE